MDNSGVVAAGSGFVVCGFTASRRKEFIFHRNRVSHECKSICHPWSQHRDLIYDGEINSEDRTNLKSIAADIGSAAPRESFVNFKAEL
jgi:hypothetical protein